MTRKLPFCLLPNWGEKSLTCQIPEGEEGSVCLHLPVSRAKPEHYVVQDCFSLKVCSAFLGLISFFLRQCKCLEVDLASGKQAASGLESKSPLPSPQPQKQEDLLMWNSALVSTASDFTTYSEC
ncbi:hypothetical protein MJG53_013241 [Ovis ammon polii x Ovis aries]|uniref:Uncharacterized protein n=1 Tax=Ovis ammon polii x Ovis aries TaxID=2918886 RepID=A0ACB9UIJ0_9CETA|nr:hypothetical protein MJG53_013241 [Ovis ammon polii x Ovis aries]